MPVFPTQLDGQNVVLSITAPDTFVDVMSVNVVTGAVSSAWLPSTWIRPLELAVELSNSVIPPLDRTSVNYLARVLNTLSMDDSVFAASNILTANPDIRSLRITVAVGNDPAVLLLNLPHSITGAFAVADGAQGVAPPVILAGDVVGPSNTNQLVAYGPGAVTRGAADKSAIVTTDTKGRVFTLTEAAIQIAEAQVTGLVADLASKADKATTITGADGCTGGGDLSANRTITLPAVGTPGTYGNSTTVPVFTTDAKGRVTGVTPTPIAFPTPPPPTAVWAQFSDATDQGLSGTPLDIKYDTKDGGVAGITAAVDPVTGRASRLTVSDAGVYAFTVSPQLQHFGGGGAELIYFYAVTDAGTLANSASYVDLANNNRSTLPYLELILPMSAGGWVQWWLAGTPGTSIRLNAIAAAPPVPAAPSVIAGVKLIGV